MDSTPNPLHYGELGVTPRQPRYIVSESALSTIVTLERIGSVFSLLGSLFVMVTFVTSHAFRKPINRLVFYASFGNLAVNVGTLMSRSFVNVPNSFGCQLQGFLIQMFMPADACWTLAMAINVYLTFYHKFDAVKLRKMEKYYIGFSYGVPLVPAFTYIWIKDKDGHRVYGDATLWCWVTPEWNIWRIITFYAPVWLVIGTTIFIYLRAGRTIYMKRKQLYNISIHEAEADPYSVKTTEVCVTTEVVDSVDGIVPSALTADPNRNPHRHHQQSSNATQDQQGPGGAAYSVMISADIEAAEGSGTGPAATANNTTIGNIRSGATRQQRRKNWEMNNAAWSYAKCAILFFTAILITWIPSSANRVYSVFNNNHALLGLEYLASFVLPLQGFWNCLIYITTSWTGCKTYFRELGLAPQPKHTESVALRPDFGRRDGNNKYETESMTELHISRPDSHEQSLR